MKEHRSRPEETLNSQSWNDLSNEINEEEGIGLCHRRITINVEGKRERENHY